MGRAGDTTYIVELLGFVFLRIETYSDSFHCSNDVPERKRMVPKSTIPMRKGD